MLVFNEGLFLPVKAISLQSSILATNPPHPNLATPAAPVHAFDEVQVGTLRLNSILPFVLYTKIEGELIVYRRENLPFTLTQKQALQANQIEVLYVSSDQASQFWEYLRGCIQHIVEDPDADLEARAAVFHRCANELIRRFFELPFTKQHAHEARCLASDTLRYLSRGKEALHALMREMDQHTTLSSHAVNVCAYGLMLAQEVGISDPSELEEIGMGLLIQDIGMLKVPEHLLFKPGPLSFEEWSLVKRHPTLGIEAVERIREFPKLASAIIFGHHERLDGSGYPQGLAGAEVSQHLRIAGIADAFAALTSARPFRAESTTVEALTAMKADLAESYDTQLLDRFIRILGE